jgi:hypothetical protein
LCDNILAEGAGIGAYTVAVLILQKLVQRGVMEPGEIASLLDEGLLQLEERQLTVPVHDRRAWAAARTIIEETLPVATRLRLAM